jgi:hypothetical protein
MTKYDVVIIGGGFYGCSLAIDIASKGKTVVLLEKEREILARASQLNQARIHAGYHYPRSFLTGIRSKENLALFVDSFPKVVVKDFTKLYAIARNSLVTAKQFSEFANRIGAPILEADLKYKNLFSSSLVEKVFEVQEYAFDWSILANILSDRMRMNGVQIKVNSAVQTVKLNSSNRILVEGTVSNTEPFSMLGSEVYLVAYSNINEVLTNSALPIIPLKHEFTEMALVSLPPDLKNLGITVMDGPFWSLMPYPSRAGLSTLSHVRYTPHFHWESDKKISLQDLERKTAFNFMRKDAARFVPAMECIAHKDSLWEIKTVLPRSEANDSRPILFKRNYALPGLNVILGGKIDNIFDVLAVMNEEKGE